MRVPEALLKALRPLLGNAPEPPPAPPSTTRLLAGRELLDMVDERAEAVRAPPHEAIGLALGGVRTTSVLADPQGSDAAALRAAVRRHLPVVFLTSGGAPRPTPGALHFTPRSPQEVLDVALVARRVAEAALVPAVLELDAATLEHAAPTAVPPPALLVSWLGSAADLIACPTPVQRLVLGADERRRVPRWFDAERPVLLSPVHRPQSADLREAARAVWFASAVEPLLAEALEAYAQQIGRAVPRVVGYGAGSSVLLVATGPVSVAAERIARQSDGVGVASLLCLRPFPREALLDAARGASRVVVLERADASLGAANPLTLEVMAALPSVDVHGVGYGLAGGPEPGDADLLALAKRARDGSPLPRFVGVATGAAQSAWPKRQALLDRLRHIDPGAEHYGLCAGASETTTPRGQHTPLAVRHLKRDDDAYDSLARFWGQHGAPGVDANRVADPYLALDAVPSLSATFRDHSRGREALPAFDPEACVGCGACWEACPESAVGAVALSAEALLRGGMAQARAATDALQPLVSKVAPRITKAVRREAPTSAAAALRAGFEPLADKLPADRAEAMVAAFEATVDAVGALPVARTAPMFDDDNAAELLSVVFNPDACKGCGACSSVCEAEAIVLVAQTDDAVEGARTTWEIWEQLPDTSGDTIERLARHPDLNPLAALLLARTCLLALAGGDDGEPGSGPRLALRAALAVAEARLQPELQRLIDQVGELERRLGEQVHARMGQALPRKPDEVSDALQRGDLGERMSTSLARGDVDLDALRDDVELARSLAALRHRLAAGPDGLGRARAGLALVRDGLADWAAAYPHNPFVVPTVVLDADGAADAALGLARGLAAAATRDHALLRATRATLGEPVAAPPATWEDLTEAERASCPPLVVVASEGALPAAALHTLLGTELPVTVLLLATATGGGEGELLALSDEGALTLQTSIGAPAHLVTALQDALTRKGPALVRVHAPSPTAQGFEPDRALLEARAAVERGDQPLFRFDPDSDEPMLERARAEVRSELETAHRTAVTELEARHRVELANLRAELEAEATDKIHRKLMQLAGYGAPAGPR